MKKNNNNENNSNGNQVSKKIPKIRRNDNKYFAHFNKDQDQNEFLSKRKECADDGDDKNDKNDKDENIMTAKKSKLEINSNLISDSDISDGMITKENGADADAVGNENRLHLRNTENNENKSEITADLESTENSNNLREVVGHVIVEEKEDKNENIEIKENAENNGDEENEESKQFSKLLFLDRFSFKNMHVRALESTEVMTEMGERKTVFFYSFP